MDHISSSRVHATIIHHTNGAVYIVDLGSYHGTFVDDIRLKPLQPTLIVHGSVLKFGGSLRQYYFRVRYISHDKNNCFSLISSLCSRLNPVMKSWK